MTNSDSQDRTMILGAVLSPTSVHVAGWRHPDAVSNAGAEFDFFADSAHTAEKALLDFVFLADELCAPAATADMLSLDPVIYRYEPLTLASALAVVTKQIGIVVTQTTTYNEPYHLARKLASIDNLSGGRVGWNLVTSYVEAEARNFGSGKHASYQDRYARAEEFFSVASGLWDSWDDDAFVLDKEAGTYFDPSKMHPLDHEGEYFSVAGPLNIRRTPQGRPVAVQAGASEPGLELAAKLAEVTFTAQQDLESAQNFYSDIKRRAALNGRAADSLKVVAGLCPILGGTEAEAQANYRELQALIRPEIGLARLSQLLGFDVSGMPLDGGLPDRIPETNSYQSRQRLIVEMARREKLSLRELYQRVVTSYGHSTVIGTPEMLADHMRQWREQNATDGFMICPPVMPSGLHDFAETVVPELQRTGHFRTEYSGTTLRSHLGLARPDRGQPLPRRSVDALG
ncbi:LLM class flavin-dependent oxidoreductase [Rhodococcus sp. 1R11]|uniref:LLM class flavin-dependent oxidoreductase n=1 Tax=Rhodococcus sp. 1R11 TaxID=2559614 RepID=UPI001072128B|nr:LLM class flavin-dependent oxidoreductase [Rhodococcus sp. 1R11]TFI43547.1 LLM class flavin-dependent oxidoreductase [Rhodococcus sp. 1R11]